MPALRCELCGTNWPDDPSQYAACPECPAAKTNRFSNAGPIDIDEALSRKRHADFDRYLERTGRLTEAEILDRALAAT